MKFDSLESLNLAYGLGVLAALHRTARAGRFFDPEGLWRIRASRRAYRDQFAAGMADGAALTR